MKMIWCGLKIKENHHVLVNQSHGIFCSKTVCCRKIKSVFRDVKWCFNASWGLKGLPHFLYFGKWCWFWYGTSFITFLGASCTDFTVIGGRTKICNQSANNRRSIWGEQSPAGTFNRLFKNKQGTRRVLLDIYSYLSTWNFQSLISHIRWTNREIGAYIFS